MTVDEYLFFLIENQEYQDFLKEIQNLNGKFCRDFQYDGYDIQKEIVVEEGELTKFETTIREL